MSVPEFVDGDGDVAGVAVGVVEDNEDPEGMGRVKLRFPRRPADDESYWARIATPMAGPDRGTYFLPEVGDEVLVGFEEGEVAYPYVLGALWNGEDAPPEDNADGNNDVRLIKSRSGHEIVLDDADSAEKIRIETSAGHKLVLDDKSGSETVTIEDKSGENTIEFDAVEGSVSITGGGKLSLDAPMVELTSDGNITIDASGVLTLNGAIIQLN